MSVDSLKKQSTHQFKALGFKPEVLAKLRQAINGDVIDDSADVEQMRFVTHEEEDEDMAHTAIKSISNSKKKKKNVASFSFNVDSQTKAGNETGQADPSHAAADSQDDAANDMDHEKENQAQLRSLGSSSTLTNHLNLQSALPSRETGICKGETLT
jgi:hypothetical protein